MYICSFTFSTKTLWLTVPQRCAPTSRELTVVRETVGAHWSSQRTEGRANCVLDFFGVSPCKHGVLMNHLLL